MTKEKLNELKAFIQKIEAGDLKPIEKSKVYQNYKIAMIIFNDFENDERDFNRFIEDIKQQNRGIQSQEQTIRSLIEFFSTSNTDLGGMITKLMRLVEDLSQRVPALEDQIMLPLKDDVKTLTLQRHELETRNEAFKQELDQIKDEKAALIEFVKDHEKEYQALKAKKAEYDQLTIEKEAYEKLKTFIGQQEIVKKVDVLVKGKEDQALEADDLVNKLKVLKQIRDLLFIEKYVNQSGEAFINHLTDLAYGARILEGAVATGTAEFKASSTKLTNEAKKLMTDLFAHFRKLNETLES